MSGDINVQTFSGKVNINNNLLVGSSHLFVDTVNNRVGITTASPGASLEVNGNVHVATDVTFGGTLTGDGSGLTNISNDSGSWVNGNNSNVHLATSTDKVGIGTIVPDFKLDVHSDVFTSTRFKRTTASGGLGIKLENGDGDVWNIGTGATGTFGIYNGVTFGEQFFIDTTGHVGIFSTSPNSTFHVKCPSVNAGRVNIERFDDTNNIFTGLSGANTDGGRAQLVLSSAYSDLVIASSRVNNDHGSTLSFVTYNPSNSADYRKFVINQGNWGNRKEYLDFGCSSGTADANPHLSINSTDTVLTLDGTNKRVGIGTTSPSGVLHVVDSSANSSWNKLLVRPTTLWGDGVTTAAEDGGGPNRYMTMANIMLQNPHVCCSSAGQSAHIRIGRGGGVPTGEWWELATRTDSKFQICKSAVATTGIVIDTGGRVGIGTASPEAVLDVRSGTEIPRLRGDAGRSLFMGSNYTHVNSSGFSETNTAYAWDGYPGVVRMNSGGEWRVHGEAGYNVLIRTDGGFVPFTGLHETYLPFDEEDQGKIVYSTGNYASELKDGNVDGVMYDYLTILDACPVVKICATENDKRVMGVLSTRHRRTQIKEITKEEYELITCDEKYSYEKKEGSDVYIRDIDTDEFSRGYYNAVGEGSIWVCNKNGNFENGDYITSSTVAGYGQKQNDDLLHNYTVAKITADCDFSEIWVTTKKHKKTREGYLFDGNNEPVYENILDAEGNTRTHLKFKIRYLLPDGTQISEEEYTTRALADEKVYVAAFVGCTYHCG